MAEGGIPQGGAKGKRRPRRVVARQLRLFHHTRYAGVALVQRAWEVLGLPALLTAAGIVRRGHSAGALAFAQVLQPLVGARARRQLAARCAGDELVEAACGPLSQPACSRFLNTARCAWPALTARVTAHLQTRRELRTRPSGLLGLDDTILEKAGRVMEGLQKLYDTAKQRFVRGYGLVVLYYTDKRTAYPLGYRLTRRRRGRPPSRPPGGRSPWPSPSCTRPGRRASGRGPWSSTPGTAPWPSGRSATPSACPSSPGRGAPGASSWTGGG